MIPKIIHYAWVGEKQQDYLTKVCIESWVKYFPDYELRLWNEKNIPFNDEYVQRAYKNKNWSNISNYIRLYALREFGGIYFDTDFEVIKPFDFLHKCKVFLGFEDDILNVNSAVIGSIKNSNFINTCYERLIANFDGTEASNLSGPGIVTDILKEQGLSKTSQAKINEVNIFPIKYFYPFPWKSVLTYQAITNETYGIHHWAKSWIIDDLNQQILHYQNIIESYKNRDKLMSHHVKSIIYGIKDKLLK